MKQKRGNFGEILTEGSPFALEGYPLAEKRTVEQISAEAFPIGYHDKDAAQAATEKKEPKGIHKVLKYAKASIANHRAIVELGKVA